MPQSSGPGWQRREVGSVEREAGQVLHCALSRRAGERLSVDSGGRPPGEDRTCSEVGGDEREEVDSVRYLSEIKFKSVFPITDGQNSDIFRDLKYRIR